MDYNIEEFGSIHISWAQRILVEHWGSIEVVTRGNVIRADILPGYVAVMDGEPCGLATYQIAARQCELVTLNAIISNRHIGSGLVEAVSRQAIAQCCDRLWMITTNDNTNAIRFYQKRGFSLAKVHIGAMNESRKLKPGIPLIGIDGIPIRDELELEKVL